MSHDTKTTQVEMNAFDLLIQRGGETLAAMLKDEQAVVLFWNPTGEVAQDRGVTETDSWAIYAIEKNDVAYETIDLPGERGFAIHWKAFVDLREVVLFADESLAVGTHFSMFSRNGNRIRFTNLAGSDG